MKLNECSIPNAEEIEHWHAIPRAYLLKPDVLTPFEVYLILKDSFGDSNVADFDEDMSQWAYLLKFQNGYIHIYDWKFWTWSIAVHPLDGSEETGRVIAEGLLKQFEHLAQKNRPRLKAVSGNAKAYIIQNPFALYYQTATELLNLAQFDTRDWGSSRQMKIASARFGVYSKPALCRSALLLLLASFEGLLNLIYELYLKESLRDERIYERLSREQIDLKFRLAPVYCSCFGDAPIDPASDAFRNFQTLVNLRNDFIHANLTKSMRFPLITKDGLAFAISPFEKESSIGVPRNFGELQEQHLQQAKRIIDDAIDFVLKHMKPRYRKEFVTIMEDDNVSIEFEDGEWIVV
jgi:hypothetical protein